MATTKQVYQHAVDVLPLIGLVGHFYYIENGNGTDLDEYLADSTGALRFIGTRPSNTISYVSAESIPSHTPVAIYNNLAYKLDASNTLHQFAFVGFSKNGTSVGQECIIQQVGEVELIGWGLIPNKQYLAGTNGAIVLDNITLNNFTKVVGYATTSNTLQIIKDFSSINKI
jgi:hypothetical protein